MSGVDGDIQAVSQSGGSFQSKLVDTLTGLSNANKERKGEIDSLRHDHEELKKNHESFVTSAERENDLRKNEIKSLEEKMQKENQVMIIIITMICVIFHSYFQCRKYFSGTTRKPDFGYPRLIINPDNV